MVPLPPACISVISHAAARVACDMFGCVWDLRVDFDSSPACIMLRAAARVACIRIGQIVGSYHAATTQLPCSYYTATISGSAKDLGGMMAETGPHGPLPQSQLLGRKSVKVTIFTLFGATLGAFSTRRASPNLPISTRKCSFRVSGWLTEPLTTMHQRGVARHRARRL
jgi:hypothetical protein